MRQMRTKEAGAVAGHLLGKQQEMALPTKHVTEEQKRCGQKCVDTAGKVGSTIAFDTSISVCKHAARSESAASSCVPSAH
jgi:hypothetical protein